MTGASSSAAALILLLDTSLKGVSAGLVHTGRVSTPDSPRDFLLWQASHLEVMGSAQAVAGLISDGLTQTDRSWSDIAGISAAHGPGTFTGIRIGLAFVAGLQAGRPFGQQAWRCRGVSALSAALRWRIRHRGLATGSWALLLPATRTQGYMAFYRERTGSFGEQVLDFDLPDWEQKFFAPDVDFNYEIFGQWPVAETAIKARSIATEYINVPPSELCEAAIYGMTMDAVENWPSGFSIAGIEPCYLRLSTAEERLQQLKS